MSLIDAEEEGSAGNDEAAPQDQTHVRPAKLRVHSAIIKREKRFIQAQENLKKVGYRLNPLRYIGQLMRL